ncbi:3-carboxy-cis,cis-muconate cycloisomerase [Nitratireductor aestuarii]|uniref:3-carboxy-cis,cis-muconate cycloisomerase n=1 Tax=Nitratireductor aestuarii TaxID=1735103 RepID=A0A916W6H0_9HYPH|nr:3-carboxy-cis,cis-muconate cycloisomerase [Nitratireductor aestuarii]GGA70089.1 3-carboxy-cis,cis-muconate cycloisomerase [Nitratireductor aestuarii]
MSAAAIDHPFFTKLVGDEEAAALFSVEAEVDALLRFELALARAESRHGIIPAEAVPAIEAALNGFTPDVEAIATGLGNDGVVIPALLKQLRAKLSDDLRPHLHFGATSQDAIDTALALRLAKAIVLLDERLEQVINALDALEDRDGAVEVMGHTRMQAAIPVAARRKIRSWSDPLLRDRARLKAVGTDVEVLHLGGAAGTLEKFDGKGNLVAADMAAELKLRPVDQPRHTERDGIAAFASVLSLITGSLGKFGQDVALMAQNEVGEINLATGGGSSAMPHKKNPVPAEVLVTLARFNATLLSGMHHSVVHENERSGAAWTLEWMLLPQMVVATAAALRLASNLAQNISFNGVNRSV